MRELAPTCHAHALMQQLPCAVPQIREGFEFESETDTEVIPKLMKYVYDNICSDKIPFREVSPLCAAPGQ